MSLRTVVLCLTLFYTSLAVAGDDTDYTLDSVRLGQLEGRTRVVFDVSGPVGHQLKMLADPPRVVLQLPNTVSKTAISETPLSNTLITAMFSSQGDDSALHVVLELKQRVSYKILLLKPYGERGDRLVLDLYPGSIEGASSVSAVSESAAASTVQTGASSSETANARYDFSGTWEQEWAVETDGGDSQKFEALIEPRLDIDLSGSTRLTAIARIRLDSVGDLGPSADRADNYSGINGPFYNDTHAEFSLRELYLDATWGNSYWRLGKQQVVWGQADGIKVLDVVNPQSFREFIMDDFDDSRIPLTMVNLELPTGEGSTLQLLWIPDTTYHELAEVDTPYTITSPNLVPVAPEGLVVDLRTPDKPDDPLADSDAGVRFSSFYSGWDITLNYLYHYQDFPVYYQELQLSPVGARGIVTPEYERNHLLGGTLSNVFGDLVLRAELAYSTDTFHISDNISRRGIESSPELASVIGLDWNMGKYDTLLSVQWFQSHLFDYRSAIHREETEHNASFLYTRTFANETLQFDALALYSLNHRDSMLQFKMKYLWSSSLELWLGADLFSGTREGLYGQFKDRDRILLGLKLGF